MGGSYTDMGDTTDHRPVVCLVYLDCTEPNGFINQLESWKQHRTKGQFWSIKGCILRLLKIDRA